MDDEQLQAWVSRISNENFGLPFRHEAKFNPKLRTTGGRYFTKSHHIEINPSHLETFGSEEVEKIIKHELCHYHLHLGKKGYQHKDADFKQLLQKVGGSRFCQTLPGTYKAHPYRYQLICKDCQLTYRRKHKVDVKKYVCGACKGKLKLVEF